MCRTVETLETLGIPFRQRSIPPPDLQLRLQIRIDFPISGPRFVLVLYGFRRFVVHIRATEEDDSIACRGMCRTLGTPYRRRAILPPVAAVSF